ncbi:MAG: hypothetical protein JSU00_11615 [Acidobacteria bacterium]|nr:hypothetical protein [Acidobacteriota bacterium]
MATGAAVAFWRSRPVKRLDRVFAFNPVVDLGGRPVVASAISLNGKRIAYASDDSVVRFRDLEGAELATVSLPQGWRIRQIVWLADGSGVIVSAGVAEEGGTQAVWRLAANGGAAHPVAENAAWGAPSPDGGSVAFVDSRQPGIRVAGSGSVRGVVSFPAGETVRALNWSVDGRRISYQRATPAGAAGSAAPENRIETVDVASGKVTAIAPGVVAGYACRLPDGRLLFSGHPAGGDGGIWEVRTDSATGAFLNGPKKVLDRESVGGLSSTWDGKHLMGVGTRIKADVYIGAMEFPGPRLTGVRNVTGGRGGGNNYVQGWTPDSASVIFTTTRHGTRDVYRQGLQDSLPRPVVATPLEEFLAQTTSDGQWLLFASKAARNDPSTLRRIGMGGGAPEDVPIGGPLDEFRCPTDPGRNCVLRTIENGFFIFWELDPARGKVRQLSIVQQVPSILGDWGLSADGMRVAIPIHDRNEARLRVLANGADTVTDVELSGLSALRGVHWASDGKGWYVTTERHLKSSLYYVEASGASHLLREIDGASWGIPSPDGKLLAFVDYVQGLGGWLFDRD